MPGLGGRVLEEVVEAGDEVLDFLVGKIGRQVILSRVKISHPIMLIYKIMELYTSLGKILTHLALLLLFIF